MMNKKKSILLTFILLIVGGLSTLAAAAPDGDTEPVAKIGTTEYATLADAVTAANANDEVVIIKEGTYTIPGLPKNITIKADKNVEVTFNCEGSGSIASIPNGATFEGVTMNFGQSAYHGFQHAGTINMNSCTLNGLFFSYGDMNFNGCTFNQTDEQYMMWCYAGDLTYTNCEFNGKGKFLNIYNEGNGSWKISVAGCKFNSDTKNKAALNIKETCSNKGLILPFEVTIGEDNELEGNFPANSTSESLIVGGGGLWQVDDRYTTDLTKSLVVVKDAEGNILYEATNAEGAAEEIKVDYGLDITSNEGDSELTGEEKTKAEEAVNELASNTDATTLPEETKTNNNAAVKDEVLGEGQSVIVNIEIKSAKVEKTGDDGIVIKKVAFDVTPYVTISDVAKNKIDNDQIEDPITFRLPVSKDVAYNCAEVFHAGTSIGIKTITEGTTGKYLEISSKEFSEFSYVLMSEPTSVTYYAANETAQTGSFDAFTTAVSTCKNAIAIVSSQYKEWAGTQTNVVIDYGEGETNDPRYVCPKFVLTDLEDFYSPVDFVAEAGSYTRTNTQGLNSVCLPFAITEAKVNNGKIGTYKSSNIEDGTGTISFEEVNSVDAGVPCIVDCEDNNDWAITFENTAIVATPVNDNPMKGSYVAKVIGTNHFKVSSDGTKFVNTVSDSKVFPFRAYLDLTTQAGAKELTIEWNEGSTTGINTIESKHIDNIIYDLTGRKVNNTVKGSVYIMNGKKYIK